MARNSSAARSGGVFVLFVMALLPAARGAVTYGHGLLPLFGFAPGYVNLNHGSFGACPHAVLEAQREYVRLQESRPDEWFRLTYIQILEKVQARVAGYINANKSTDVVFVENASAGVNAVLRSLNLGSGDKVLYLSTAYSMVPNTINWLAHHSGVVPLSVPVDFPFSSTDVILQSVRTALAANPEVRLACFSHITSVPSFILPVKALVALCHKFNVQVMIDGAHALGHIPIDVRDIDADYYITNAHKWLYSPKGTALLWVRPDRQQAVAPTVISSSGRTDFAGEFEYTGTRDYTAFCTIDAALDFREKLGGDTAIMSYIHDIALAGGHALAQLWKTSLLVPDDLVGALVSVRLPSDDDNFCSRLTDQLLKRFNTYIVVYKLQATGWWVRVSGQVYLEKSDFEWMGQAVLTLLNEYKSQPAEWTCVLVSYPPSIIQKAKL